MQARAGKLILPVFQKIQLCNGEDQGAQLFARRSGFDKELYYRADIGIADAYDERNGNECNLFPVVTNASGGVWEPALLYLAYRVFDLANCTMATNHNVADDLVHFKRFLDDKNSEFDNFDSPASVADRSNGAKLSRGINRRHVWAGCQLSKSTIAAGCTSHDVAKATDSN